MTDAALLELRRMVALVEAQGERIAELHRLVQRLAPSELSPAQAELLAAIADACDWAFRAGELIELGRSAQAERQRLLAALRALKIGPADTQRLGMVLAELVKRSALLDVRLVRAGQDNNAKLWAIERVPLGT